MLGLTLVKGGNGCTQFDSAASKGLSPSTAAVVWEFGVDWPPCGAVLLAFSTLRRVYDVISLGKGKTSTDEVINSRYPK